MHRIGILATLSCGVIAGILCAGPLSSLHTLAIPYFIPARFTLYSDLLKVDPSAQTIAVRVENPFPDDAEVREIQINFTDKTIFSYDGSIDDGPTGSPSGMRRISIADIGEYSGKRHARVIMQPTDTGTLVASGIIFIE